MCYLKSFALPLTTDLLSSTAGPTDSLPQKKKQKKQKGKKNMNVNLCDCGLWVFWGPDPD